MALYSAVHCTEYISYISKVNWWFINGMSKDAAWEMAQPLLHPCCTNTMFVRHHSACQRWMLWLCLWLVMWTCWRVNPRYVNSSGERPHRAVGTVISMGVLLSWYSDGMLLYCPNHNQPTRAYRPTLCVRCTTEMCTRIKRTYLLMK